MASQCPMCFQPYKVKPGQLTVGALIERLQKLDRNAKVGISVPFEDVTDGLVVYYHVEDSEEVDFIELGPPGD